MSSILKMGEEVTLGAAKWGSKTGLYLGLGVVAASIGTIPPVRSKVLAREARQQAAYEEKTAPFTAWKELQHRAILAAQDQETPDNTEVTKEEITVSKEQAETPPHRHSVEDSLTMQDYIAGLVSQHEGLPVGPHQDPSFSGRVYGRPRSLQHS